MLETCHQHLKLVINTLHLKHSSQTFVSNIRRQHLCNHLKFIQADGIRLKGLLKLFTQVRRDFMLILKILRWMQLIPNIQNHVKTTYDWVHLVPGLEQWNNLKNVAEIFYFFQQHMDIENQWHKISCKNRWKLSVSMTHTAVHGERKIWNGLEF